MEGEPSSLHDLLMLELGEVIWTTVHDASYNTQIRREDLVDWNETIVQVSTKETKDKKDKKKSKKQKKPTNDSEKTVPSNPRQIDDEEELAGDSEISHPTKSYSPVSKLHRNKVDHTPSKEDMNKKKDKEVWNGTLVVTNFRLVFFGVNDKVDEKEANGPHPIKLVEITLGAIARIEKLGRKSVGNVYSIAIRCKDIRDAIFDFPPASDSRRKIYKLLDQNIFNLEKIFAFTHHEHYQQTYKSCPHSVHNTVISLRTNECENGWHVYSGISREFKRMFNPVTNRVSSAILAKWRISYINDSYKISPSYPSILIVPTAVSDNDLNLAALFRSKGRLPALTYIHPNGATLTRASQPLTGLKRKESEADQHLVEAIRLCNSESKTLYIVDARPKANAVANMPRGGGYEQMANYSNISLEFLSIENIHVMRQSLAKLQHLVSNSSDQSTSNWLSDLNNTRWLEHIRLILQGTSKIVEKIDGGYSVLVHCSDGWDRTAQLTSLAQLCLDPYFRTIEGFQVIVEKEWSSFGHKYQERIGHADSNYADAQRSPVFVQFVDCVFQLYNQFPTSFEFGMHFLITVLDNLYSCKYGTFLCNTERERKEQEIATRTSSLWTFLNKNKKEYLNPFYDPSSANGILLPAATSHEILYWKEYYSRYRWRKTPRVYEMGSKDNMSSYSLRNMMSQPDRIRSGVHVLEKMKIENELLKQKLDEIANKETDEALLLLQAEKDKLEELLELQAKQQAEIYAKETEILKKQLQEISSKNGGAYQSENDLLKQKLEALEKSREEEKQQKLLLVQKLEKLEAERKQSKPEAKKVDGNAMSANKTNENTTSNLEEEKLVDVEKRREHEEQEKIAKMRFKRGFLSKQGHVVKNWKVRYFLIEQDQLLYFSDSVSNEEAAEEVQRKQSGWKGSLRSIRNASTRSRTSSHSGLKGALPLAQLQIEPHVVDPDGRQKLIAVNKKDLLLSATSPEEREDWIEALKYVSAAIPAIPQ